MAYFRFRTSQSCQITLAIRCAGIAPGGSRDLRIFVPGAAAKHFKFSDRRSHRIVRQATLVILRVEPIRHPFADVTGHLIDAVRAHALVITIHVGEGGILKPALRPRMRDIAFQPSGWLIAPGENSPILTARGFFPFRFGRKPFPHPSTIGIGFFPAHPDDRMRRHLLEKWILHPERRPDRTSSQIQIEDSGR